MMWFVALFAFLMILVGALWMGQVSSEMYKEDVQKKHRAGLLKRRCQEIEELTQKLVRYDTNENLIKSVTEFLINQIEKRQAIYPDDEEIEEELAVARHRLENANQFIGKNPFNIPTNDFEIDELRKDIARLLKLLKVMYPKGYFLEEDFMAHSDRLKVLLLKTETNAYVQQGKVALKLGDRLTAASYFKHAKERLVAAEQSFPERTDMVKRISKMISSIYSTEKEFETVSDAMESGRFDLNIDFTNNSTTSSDDSEQSADESDDDDFVDEDSSDDAPAANKAKSA